MRTCLSYLIMLGLVVSLGCGDMGGSRRNASGSIGGAGLVAPDQQVSQPAPAAQPAAAPGSAISAAAQLGQGAAVPTAAAPGAQDPAVAAQAPAGAPAQPNLVQEKAQAGVSGKGNYGPGVVTTPIGAYFQARERIVFEIAIPGAMNLYVAEKGYKPKTQEDFMRDIIQFNQIKLPELPPGHKYVYDPQKGELMVEHPQ
jgi:hypothetical protein